MAVYRLHLQDKIVSRGGGTMQILQIEHLLEVLYRAIDLNLQQDFIDLLVSEIHNKQNINSF
jgi:hypothetical protein